MVLALLLISRAAQSMLFGYQVSGDYAMLWRDRVVMA